MTRRRLSPPVVAALVAAHLVVTRPHLAWTSANRADDEIRGSKRFWRIASAAQMGNSLAYWLFGRKRIA